MTSRSIACILGGFVVVASSAIGSGPGAATVKAQSVLSPDLGMITSFDVPGATNTFALDINAAGFIVGRYLMSGRTHGLLRTPEGDLTTIDVPGAILTVTAAINNQGDIAGQFALPTAPNQRHGFLLKGGAFTSFDPPGSTFTNVL